VSGGCVQVIWAAGRGPQTAAVFEEIDRLRLALRDTGFADFAVLARTRAELDPIRAWCEVNGVPCRRRVESDAMPPLASVREVARALDLVGDLGSAAVGADDLRTRLGLPAAAEATNPWTALVARAVEEWRAESAGAALPASEFLEFLHEMLADQRRGHVVGEGVYLSTVHGAKGLEFPHVFVLDGGWGPAEAYGRAARPPDAHTAEERRVCFVAMTRAQQSLTLMRRDDAVNPFVDELVAEGGRWLRVRRAGGSPAVASEVLARRWVTLSLADVDLGFAGRRDNGAPLHRRLDALHTGQPVTLRADAGRVVVADAAGHVVGALSAKACAEWAPRLPDVVHARVFAMVRRDRSLGADEFRDSVRVDEWEVPLVELAVESR
jgi:ATP-dependent DNA helicase RecQ